MQLAQTLALITMSVVTLVLAFIVYTIGYKSGIGESIDMLRDICTEDTWNLVKRDVKQKKGDSGHQWSL